MYVCVCEITYSNWRWYLCSWLVPQRATFTGFALVCATVPVLARLLSHPDAEVLEYACRSLSYLADQPVDTKSEGDRIQAVIESGATRHLVELLRHRSHEVATAALAAVDKLLQGDGAQTQLVLDCDVLPCLLVLLSQPNQDLSAQVALVLRDMVVRSVDLRNRLLQAGALHALRELDQQPNASAQLHSSVALLQQHEPYIQIADPVAQACAMLLGDHEHIQVHAVRILRNRLSVEVTAPTQQVIDAPGVLQRLVHFLRTPHPMVLQVNARA